MPQQPGEDYETYEARVHQTFQRNVAKRTGTTSELRNMPIVSVPAPNSEKVSSNPKAASPIREIPPALVDRYTQTFGQAPLYLDEDAVIAALQNEKTIEQHQQEIWRKNRAEDQVDLASTYRSLR